MASTFSEDLCTPAVEFDGHIALMEGMRDLYRVLAGNLARQQPFARKDNIKRVLTVWREGVDCVYLVRIVTSGGLF